MGKAEHVEGMRLAQLRAFAPALFAPGTLLYVGACPWRAQCLAELVAAGRRVTILEVWAGYRPHFERQGYEVLVGDVRAADDLAPRTWDVAFWWHGPEHLERGEVAAALAALERRAATVVLGCPWGLSLAADLDDNPHQRHRSALYPEDLQTLGYRVDTLGSPGQGSYSHVLAVKP